MVCKQCGAQIPENLYFCPECGTKREEDPAGEKQGKKKKSRIFTRAALAALAVLIVVIVTAAFLGNRKTAHKIDYDNYIDWAAYGYFWNMEGSRYSTEAEDCAYNGDHSLAVYTVYERDVRTLYYIDSTLEPKRVAENVVSYGVSYTGEYIAYVTDAESEVSGTLYLYGLNNEKGKKIDEGVYPGYFCLSPAGNTVAYIRDFEDMGDFTLYLGGMKIKNREINDDNCAPVAVADDGKTLYYINDDYRLFVYDGKESEKLASGAGTHFFFNQDMSEMLFSAGGDTYYYTRKLDEPVKVSGKEIQDVAVAGDIVYFAKEGGSDKFLNIDSNLLGVTTVRGSVLEMQGGIYWLNSEAENAVKIGNSMEEGFYQIAEDGKSVIYVMNGCLYKISRLDEKMEAKLLYDKEEIEYVAANADLSRIYLVIDEELHYLKGKNKTEELSDDVMPYVLVMAYHEGIKRLFFVEDDTLYSAGTRENSVEEIADNVRGVYAFADGIVYITEEGEDEELSFFYIDENMKTQKQ